MTTSDPEKQHQVTTGSLQSTQYISTVLPYHYSSLLFCSQTTGKISQYARPVLLYMFSAEVGGPDSAEVVK